MKMRERTSFSNVRIIGGGRLLRRCENQLTVSFSWWKVVAGVGCELLGAPGC